MTPGLSDLLAGKDKLAKFHGNLIESESSTEGAVGGLLVFGLRFHVYPVMLYTGASAGVLLGTRWAALNGLPAAKINAAMLLLLLPALAGARLLFVASRWDAFRKDLTRIGRCSEGGAALYGGLILAL